LGILREPKFLAVLKHRKFATPWEREAQCFLLFFKFTVDKNSEKAEFQGFRKPKIDFSCLLLLGVGCEKL
jgi:hypothetical protein